MTAPTTNIVMNNGDANTTHDSTFTISPSATVNLTTTKTGTNNGQGNVVIMGNNGYYSTTNTVTSADNTAGHTATINIDKGANVTMSAAKSASNIVANGQNTTVNIVDPGSVVLMNHGGQAYTTIGSGSIKVDTNNAKVTTTDINKDSSSSSVIGSNVTEYKGDGTTNITTGDTTDADKKVLNKIADNNTTNVRYNGKTKVDQSASASTSVETEKSQSISTNQSISNQNSVDASINQSTSALNSQIAGSNSNLSQKNSENASALKSESANQSQSNSITASTNKSESLNQSTVNSENASTSLANSENTSANKSTSLANSETTSLTASELNSEDASQSLKNSVVASEDASRSLADSTKASENNSLQDSVLNSQSLENSQSVSEANSMNARTSLTNSETTSANASESLAESISNSQGASTNKSTSIENSILASELLSESLALSENNSANTSNSLADSTKESENSSNSIQNSENASTNASESLQNSINTSMIQSQSISASNDQSIAGSTSITSEGSLSGSTSVADSVSSTSGTNSGYSETIRPLPTDVSDTLGTTTLDNAGTPQPSVNDTETIRPLATSGQTGRRLVDQAPEVETLNAARDQNAETIQPKATAQDAESVANKSTKTANTNEKLPQTNEAEDVLKDLGWLPLGLAGLAGIAALKKKKDKEVLDNKDLIMKSYITQLHGLSDGRQTLMQNMVAKIAQEVDIQPLSLYYFTAEQESDAQLNSRLDGIIGGVRANDTVIIQTPTLISLNYSTMLFKKLVALRQLINIKLIAFVENIFAQEKEVIEQCVSLYNNCDALIISSQLAVDKLKEYGLTNNKIITFDYFDYEPTLDISKSSVLKSVINCISDEQSPNQLNVFRQAGYAVNKFSKQDIENDLLVNEINQNGGFGLIWSNARESNEYYSLANPIELGIFISAGMPVITKKKYFCSKFIEEKNLGFTVDNIDEAIAKLELLTENDYRSMVKEVEKAALITRNGISIKKALIDAIFQANLPKID